MGLGSTISLSATYELENVTACTERMENDQFMGVRYLGLVSSAIIALAPFMFIVLFIKMGPSCVPLRPTVEDLQRRLHYTAEVTRRCSIILTAIILFVCFIFRLLETLTHFISVFEKRNYGRVYNFTHGICRLLALLLSKKLPARYTILADNVFVIVGFVLMFFTVHGQVLMAVAFGAVGFGLAAWFPRLLIITSHYTRINGLVAALFAGVNMVGNVVGAHLPVYFNLNVIDKAETITCFALSLLSLVILVSTVVYIQKFSRRRPMPSPQQASGANPTTANDSELTPLNIM